MHDKLNQYDLLARLVPGGSFLWTLNWILICSKIGGIPFVQGDIKDAIAFAFVAYVVGLILDSAGRWTVEPLVFKLFGKPSRTLLVDRQGISPLERKHFQELAAAKFSPTVDVDFSAADRYDQSEFMTRRVLGLFSSANDKTRSMQTQYVLHRSLAAASFLLFILTTYISIGVRKMWPAALFELFLGAYFLLGANHWGFRVVRTVYDQLDADALGIKVPSEPKSEAAT